MCWSRVVVGHMRVNNAGDDRDGTVAQTSTAAGFPHLKDVAQ
jgi:hypothetical protein